jgi:hypothetical protein
VFLPPLKPVPKNASDADRKAMYWEYCDLLVKLKPSRFLAIGVKKRWWNLKRQHPRTR